MHTWNSFHHRLHSLQIVTPGQPSGGSSSDLSTGYCGGRKMQAAMRNNALSGQHPQLRSEEDSHWAGQAYSLF